ncbi:GNAT family N-acetyltransferase [Kribbella lupini]|uniref:N-acetyltransferase domain-containing protein n=1 Tax=Kribbella lupini TaxID=291602 RepID=A0ABN2A1X9_9ACTN
MDLRALAVTDGVDAVRAGFTPEFVALDNDKLIGCTAMRWWDESDGTRLYLLLGWVEPVFRGRGYGREILAWQEAQARDHLAANPTDGTACTAATPASTTRPSKRSCRRPATRSPSPAFT